MQRLQVFGLDGDWIIKELFWFARQDAVRLGDNIICKINGSTPFSFLILVLYEAYRRIFEPPEIQGLPMIIVAAIGLGVNFTGMRLLGSSGHSHGGSKVHNGHLDKTKEHEEEESLIVKSAYLEVLNDRISAAGVIAAGVRSIPCKYYYCP